MQETNLMTWVMEFCSDLLLSDLERLHVVANDLQFVFQLNRFPAHLNIY